MASQTQFADKYGPWALVTGASAGIGAEFAGQLAGRGLNLVLVARREQKLRALADRLQHQYEVEVRVAAADLSQPDFMDSIRQATADIEVGLLVNNAGVYFVGEFLDQSLDAQLAVLDVNTRAPMLLTYEFGQQMRRRNRGGIIMVSSTVSGTGAPFNANYAATKSYDLAFGEGLQYELRQAGVDVEVLMPGGTRTEGAGRMMKDAPGYMNMMMMDAGPVVTASLNKLGRKTTVIPGFVNGMMTLMVSRLMPRSAAVRMWAFMMKGMLPKTTRPQVQTTTS